MQFLLLSHSTVYFKMSTFFATWRYKAIVICLMQAFLLGVQPDLALLHFYCLLRRGTYLATRQTWHFVTFIVYFAEGPCTGSMHVADCAQAAVHWNSVWCYLNRYSCNCNAHALDNLKCEIVRWYKKVCTIEILWSICRSTKSHLLEWFLVYFLFLGNVMVGSVRSPPASPDGVVSWRCGLLTV